MDFFNFWNKLGLLWKKSLILTFFSFVIFNSSFAQKYQEVNLPNSDNHKLHYGFFIGGQVAKYQIKYSRAFLNDDSIQSVKPQISGGISLGFLVNKRLGDYFDLRLLPTACLFQSRLIYNYTGNAEPKTETIEATYAELPLLLKYKSERRKNFRMYLVGGIKPSFEVTNKKGEEMEHLNLEKVNLSVDFGVGVDIYYPMFKFSPEIRFSQGIVNMLAPTNSSYNKPLDILRTHMVSVFLIFGS